MSKVFLHLLNISITASWIVLAVLVLRLLLKKAPKWISCVLWSIVALRLIVPMHIQSPLSLIPSAEVIPQDILTAQTPAIHSGIPIVNSTVNPVLAEHVQPAGGILESLLFYGSVVWIVGMAVLLLYGIISALLLRRQVCASLRIYDNVYACDEVASAFVLGVIRPRIYVPSGLSQEQINYVLAHENAHLKRRDHWWKPLGFLLLSIYWFNPLMWVAYILLTRDIERACDEKVVAEMDKAQKRGYSEALEACSMQRRMIMVCPVAFGEVSVKDRIKSVLSYKKPAFWIIIASVAACAVAAVCFLTDPFPCIHQYESKITLSATCTARGKETFTCKKCKHSYVKNVGQHDHTYDDGVVLTPPACTTEGLMAYTCTGCGKKRTEPIEMLPHTVGEVTVTKESNCTEHGQGTTVCTACGTGFAVSLPTNDVHELTETVVKAATCVDPGEGLIACTRCSYEQKCIYEILAHNYKETYIAPASCNYDGSRRLTCEDCGKYYWEVLPRTWKHVYEDTYDDRVERCKICGHIQFKPSSNSYSIYDPNRYYTGIPYSCNWTGKPELPVVIWDPNG